MRSLLNHQRFFLIITLFAGIYITTLILAPLIGPTRINIANAISGGPNSTNNIDANILFIARLPRVLMASLVGAALGVAGVVFQALLRNDLAAPFTLGVTSGAALGAVIAIRLGFSFSFLGLSTAPLAAFIGALGAILLVFTLVGSRRGEFSTSVILLAGVTVNFFFAALVMLVHYMADITQSLQIVRWLMGSLDITGYAPLKTIAPMVFIGILVILYVSRDLNVISAGSEPAMGRGINVSQVQLTGFLGASLITGAVVSISGPITFVGLIVPHIVRLLIGPDNRLLIPACMFFGASFMISCDTVARMILAPTEIPVGIITAILGGPFFIWLLKKQT